MIISPEGERGSIYCDINQTALATLDKAITAFVCDVLDSSELESIFKQILPNGMDILINNAGIAGHTKLVEEITDG